MLEIVSSILLTEKEKKERSVPKERVPASGSVSKNEEPNTTWRGDRRVLEEEKKPTRKGTAFNRTLIFKREDSDSPPPEKKESRRNRRDQKRGFSKGSIPDRRRKEPLLVERGGVNNDFLPFERETESFSKKKKEGEREDILRERGPKKKGVHTTLPKWGGLDPQLEKGKGRGASRFRNQREGGDLFAQRTNQVTTGGRQEGGEGFLKSNPRKERPWPVGASLICRKEMTHPQLRGRRVREKRWKGGGGGAF